MNRLLSLYRSWSGSEAVRVETLAGAGSNRKYYRLYNAGGASVIGVVGTTVPENETFVYLARTFAAQGIPVPGILAVDEPATCYLQTDLGHLSLYDAVARGRKCGGCYNAAEEELLHRTIRQLPRIQYEGGKAVDFSRCYPMPEMDFQAVMFDLNYFKYCFLKPSGQEFNELLLEKDFHSFAHELLHESTDTFMYRDFQARNVMLLSGNEPCFIDFQGGRRGPREYDVASFLWQASAGYSDTLRSRLIDTYLEALRPYDQVSPETFRARLNLFVLFRTLQVLGTYGLRGYCERKQYFLDSIPAAIRNLRCLLHDGVCTFPYLSEILGQLVDRPQFAADAPAPVRPPVSPDSVCMVAEQGSAQDSISGKPCLHVEVFSFSYRKGIPEDTSGNGGGYVFDCRAMHNPGRYEPYKNLTGLDGPVIRFLEEQGEIQVFLQHVSALADMHVARYIQRGFTHLQFSFGCTGGQHRSVYAAQHLGTHIFERFGVPVTVCHREQGITQTFTLENRKK